MGRIDEDEQFDVNEQVNDDEAVAEDTVEGTEAPVDTEAPAVNEAEDLTAAAAAQAEAQAEAQRKAEEAAKAQAEYDAAMKTFESAVEAAVTGEEVDRSTGTLPEVLKAPVMVAYSKLPGAKGKNTAKAYLQEKMQDRMLAGAEDNTQYTVARSYLDLIKEIQKGVTTARETVVKAPVDPTEAHVAKVAALFIAPNLVIEPEGVSPEWRQKVKEKAAGLAEQVQTYRQWLIDNMGKPSDEQSTEPEVNEIIKAAAKVAQGRATGGARKVRTSTGTTTTPAATGLGHQGPRRNVEEHIRQAFAGKVSGEFMSITEIANAYSTEYGDDHPSSGAVAARLFPKGDPSKCTLDFVTPESRDKKGAVKN